MNPAPSIHTDPRRIRSTAIIAIPVLLGIAYCLGQWAGRNDAGIHYSAYILLMGLFLAVCFRVTRTPFVGAVALIPLIGALALFLFASFAALQVGHWPSYNNPDPSKVRVPLLHGVAAILWLFSVVCIPLGGIALLVEPSFSNSSKVLRRYAGWYVLGVILHASAPVGWLLD